MNQSLFRNLFYKLEDFRLRLHFVFALYSRLKSYPSVQTISLTSIHAPGQFCSEPKYPAQFTPMTHDSHVTQKIQHKLFR